MRWALKSKAPDTVSEHKLEHCKDASPSSKNWKSVFGFPPRFEDTHIAIRGRNERSWIPREGESVRKFVNRCNQQIDTLFDGNYLTKEGANALTNSITTYYDNAEKGRDNKELLEEIKGIVKQYVREYPDITQ